MTVQAQELLNILSSPKDHTPIKFSTSECSKLIFEHIARISFKYHAYYILRPVTTIQDCEENQALVLKEDGASFAFVKDKDIIYNVFKIYYDMISEGLTYRQGCFIKSDTIVKSCIEETKDMYRNTCIRIGLKKVQKYETCFNDVIGQNNIIEGVVEYLYSELDKPKKGPRGSMIFIGPPGTGKTMLAKRIGEALGLPTLFMSMAGYSDKEANFDFAGIHKSYKAAREGTFTHFVSENPRCVVILDEFEKAHEVIIRLFLSALEDGYMRDTFTEKNVSLSETILIFTSNVCKDIYDRDLSKYNYANISKKEIIEEMSKEINPVNNNPFFSTAIVSRFAMSPIFLFNRLSPISAHKILENDIKKLIKYYEKAKNTKFYIDVCELANLLIYEEGDTNDIRSLKSRVNKFFNRFFNNLDRELVQCDPPVGYDVIDSKFSFSNNNEEVDRLVNDVYSNDYKYQILYITNSQSDRKLKSLINRYNNANIIVGDENFNFYNTSSLGLNAIILDVSDDSRLIKESFDLLIEREYDVPIYILNNRKVTKESFNHYINKGCQGVYSPLLGGSFSGWIDSIFNSLSLTTILNRLKTRCNSLSIDYGYEINNMINQGNDDQSTSGISTVSMVIKNVGVITAVSCADNKYFTPRSEMDGIKFSDIFGGEKANSEIKECLNALKNYAEYRRENLKVPKGIIMYGPPGTGKTLRAKAIAIEANLPFISLASTDFLKSVQGEGVTMVHNVFSSLRKYGGILFIDEFELISMKRDNPNSRGEYHDITNAFLAEMDGFTSKAKKPILVVAATNFDCSNERTELDKAVLRRFDYKIKIDNPNKSERLAYITKTLEKLNINNIKEKTLETISVRTLGWNYAEILNVINTFAIKLYDMKNSNFDNTSINYDEFFNEVFESMSDGDTKTYSVDELKRIAYHEAGHALVSYKLNKAPDYITIVSRGNYGGYIINSYEGKFDFNKEEMLNEVCIALAGRVSEQIIYGEKGITTGASSDIKLANMKVKRMYTDYGMLGSDLYSFDEEEIDDEGKQIIKDTLKNEYDRAKSILSNNKDTLELIVQELMDKNYLIASDFVSLVEGGYHA